MGIFLVGLGIALALLSLGVLALLWSILRCVQALTQEVAGLREGLQGLSRLMRTLGDVADDLEAGRQQVRGGVDALRQRLGGWLAMVGVRL